MEFNGKALLPDVSWRKLKHAPQNLLSGTFRSLRHPNYRLFFFGQLISLIGTWLQNTALAWLVYSLTKNAMTLGIVSFLGSIPVLFFSVLAGTFADEHPKRRILVWTQAAAGVQAILLAVAIWTGNATVVVIGIANFLLGIVNAFDMPTRQAFVVEMASKEDVTNAVALNSAVFNAARLIGPAFAGYIIYALSIDMCFFLNGISYIAVILGLMMMRFDRLEIRKRALNVTRWSAMKEGIAYLNRIPQLRALMFLVMGMTLFGWSYTVNLPVVADHLLRGGSSVYSALLAANGAGALLAALSQAAFGSRFDARRMLFVGLGAFIVGLVTLSFALSIWMAVVALVCIGWGIITFFITANTTLQRRTPDHLRGRVMSIYTLAFAGLFPFGSLFAGWLAQFLGVADAFRINAAVLLCFAVPAMLYLRNVPRLRTLPREALEALLAGEQQVIQAEQISKG
ncbi:MAG: MFS transporter [Bacteroidota bacterium]|nr:MFS transporter [Bacteroidota bacterium]MDP4233796.1 MFS transporter [Bacteroidota bacterium]MDP4242435.1 MFS transporter [Bacteroidota bacterium]MDP4287557.1 MFS transporter [Bacteroidota bacterium]